MKKMKEERMFSSAGSSTDRMKSTTDKPPEQTKIPYEHRYFNYNNTVTNKYADFSKIKKVYHIGKQGKRGGL
jgi:hypothetical protein